MLVLCISHVYRLLLLTTSSLEPIAEPMAVVGTTMGQALKDKMLSMWRVVQMMLPDQKQTNCWTLLLLTKVIVGGANEFQLTMFTTMVLLHAGPCNTFVHIANLVWAVASQVFFWMMIPGWESDNTAVLSDQIIFPCLSCMGMVLLWQAIPMIDSPKYVPKSGRINKRVWKCVRNLSKCVNKVFDCNMEHVCFCLWTLLWFPDFMIHEEHSRLVNDADDTGQKEDREVQGWSDNHPFVTTARSMTGDDDLLSMSEHWTIASENQARTSAWWGRMRLVVTSLMIAVDAGDALFAFQHIVFCLSSSMGEKQDDHRYDSDSYLIAIDNCASRCITNNMRDFVGPVVKVDLPVRGVGGTVTATYKGTVQWTIEDKQGIPHTFRIPNTYLNTSCPYRLLSPQHWAQTQSR